MTVDIYNEVWVPKIEKYLAERAEQLEPYASLVKGVDITREKFNAAEEQLKLLTPEEIEITTKYTAKELVEKQIKKELTAVQIYLAFSKRGAIAQLLTNCAMQLFFDEGLERAKELDKYRESHNGEVVGPFHGIPVSLKENLKYCGKVTTAGYVCYLDNIIDKIPTTESFTIQTFRKLGAVFYIRTSEPQAIMHLDTDNNIIGRTTNPYNSKISPGGSSGGESSCVALRGSVMGVGSDIGGSIRVPAVFCGLYGIRPTTKRISGLGSVSGGAGQESIPATQGPITTSIEDIDYFMDAYVNLGKPWEVDPNALPLPWKSNVELGETVTFGFIMTDTIVEPSGSIKRGLKYVQDKLTAYSGKKCIVKTFSLDAQLMKEAYKQNKQIYGTTNSTHEGLFAESGEPILPLTKFFLDFAAPDNNVITNNLVKEDVKMYFQGLFQKEELDFIVSPAYANVAEIPDNVRHWFYSSMFNLIDFPNISFPTGLTHDPAVDLEGPGNISDYDPQDYVNAPIGLQLTGRRFDDEKLVAGVKLLDKALGL